MSKKASASAVARITSKGQTTIPKEVRDSLDLSAGDHLSWQLRADGTVIVRKVRAIDTAYLHDAERTLSEWSSREDDKAFDGL